MDVSASIRRSKPLLGTFVEITASIAGGVDVERAIDRAFATVAQVHMLMSFHDSSSDVGKLNREAWLRPVEVHPWTFQVLQAAAKLRSRSNGTFDISVAPVLQALGLLPPFEDRRRPVNSVPLQADAVDLCSGHRVRFRSPDVAIDLGGIAKGFAVDRAIETLRNCGVVRAIVNAGGDLAAFGSPAHQVWIRDPRDPSKVLCQVEVSDEALASTGARFDPLNPTDVFGSVVIDPRSQSEIETISGATVVAPSCMIADALTKSVMIDGSSAANLLAAYGARALMSFAGGDVLVTSDWRGMVTLAA